MTENIFIKEFNPADRIEYPVTVLKGSAFSCPGEVSEKDFHFNARPTDGFDIHHIETLKPNDYFLRGLIKEDNSGKEYVFSVRVDITTYCQADFDGLIIAVTERIKAGEVG